MIEVGGSEVSSFNLTMIKSVIDTLTDWERECYAWKINKIETLT